MSDTAQHQDRRTDPWGGRVRAVWGAAALLYALVLSAAVVVGSAFVQRANADEASGVAFGWPRAWLHQHPGGVSTGALIGDLVIVLVAEVALMAVLALVFRATWHRR